MVNTMNLVPTTNACSPYTKVETPVERQSRARNFALQARVWWTQLSSEQREVCGECVSSDYRITVWLMTADECNLPKHRAHLVPASYLPLKHAYSLQ